MRVQIVHRVEHAVDGVLLVDGQFSAADDRGKNGHVTDEPASNLRKACKLYLDLGRTVRLLAHSGRMTEGRVALPLVRKVFVRGRELCG
jgi:hypothetical protein